MTRNYYIPCNYKECIGKGCPYFTDRYYDKEEKRGVYLYKGPCEAEWHFNYVTKHLSDYINTDLLVDIGGEDVKSIF